LLCSRLVLCPQLLLWIVTTEILSTKQRAGMHAQAQQERRPPSAGASGQQAQRSFSDNRSAEAHDEANVKLKTAKASGTS
jgi:hypothetical protein